MRFTAINAAAIVAAIGMAAGMHSAARAADTSATPAPPAMLAAGTKAPAVVGKSVYAGKIEDFDMSKALESGAVVLYFFPKAFTEG